MIDDERILREALADEPTPGPWMHLFGDRLVYTILEDGCRGMPVVGVDSLGGARSLWTLRYIAACSPDRIARLLDEVERLRVDAERLRAADERRKRRSVTYVCPQCAASMIRDGEKEERK